MAQHKKLRNGLTPKQSAFTNKAIESIKKTGQVNGTAIAMEVYDTTSKASAENIASDNFSKPIIKDRIEKALEGSGFSLEKNISEVIEVAISKPREITGDVKLRANLELLRLRGAFGGNQNAHLTFNINQQITNLSFDEASKRLSEMSSSGQDFIKEAEIEPSTP